MNVRYSITAIIISESKKNKKNLIHSENIVIFKEIDYPMDNVVEETKYFTSCFCINQGFIDMKLELDKGIYNCRDTIYAKFSYDNSNYHKKV